MKRKRSRRDSSRPDKRQRTSKDSTLRPGQHPARPLLEQYYQEIHSLRVYLASRLPKSSKKRRRRLLHYGCQSPSPGEPLDDPDVAELLDGIVVGTAKHVPVAEIEDIEKDISVFTQQISETDISLSPGARHLKQSEVGAYSGQIVDFAVWNLFRRQPACVRPSHILCHGFQRTTNASDGVDVFPAPGLPGIYCAGDNPYFDRLKRQPWDALPSLLGQRADRIVSELLMECGVFAPVASSSNLQQLSGVPMSELKAVPRTAMQPVGNGKSEKTEPGARREVRALSDVRLLRHRILYAKPSIKASGGVRFGMSHVHVFNRYRDLSEDADTVHIMKYIFPRQFGLHNVFTCRVNMKDTSQTFMDYTIREKEIMQARLRRKYRPGKPSLPMDHIPPRLRGAAFKMIQRLRKRHSGCSYGSVLDHYCPRNLSTHFDAVQTLKQATTGAQVSAFCKAVFRKVFPPDFFDSPGHGRHNSATITAAIDCFIQLRRFETLSLHDLMQGIRVSDIAWMKSPKADPSSKLSSTELAKRQELMAELLYYVFDSWLIPLIRSHFHVTESSAHRNRLFFFRHDVWKAISEPALLSLRDSMFEPCDAEQTKRSMSQNALGVSKVRLLPKDSGMRPIINLRRRIQRQRNGGIVLGKSINSILTPTFSILNHERTTRPDMLGSALFSVDDMFTRLFDFRTLLRDQGHAGRPLYFAKVDVKACFDTIPQARLLQLAENVLSANRYKLTRYGRAKLVGSHNEETPGFGAKPSWKFLTKATVASEERFDIVREIQQDTSAGRSRSVYVDGVRQRLEQRQSILGLLREHVESNIVKLGSRFYKQKEGIPQGSILSSLLCSYFYAELENKMLMFVKDGPSLLLRLIDDFLIITPDKSIAQQFMRTMHRGIPEFGVQVKPEKSRANFEMDIDGLRLPALPAEIDFSYCGNTINTVTLDITKDMDRRRGNMPQDSVTVEYSKLPGQTFYRKCLNALKLHMRAMLLSTKYNSVDTVLVNLYHAFSEVAQKAYHYIRSMPVSRQPHSSLLIKTTNELISLACVLMKRGKKSRQGDTAYECAVTNAQARWLACTAFRATFHRRQTKFRALLSWLDRELEQKALRVQRERLQPTVERYHR